MALVIGVDEYRNPEFNLTSAVNDARAISDALAGLGLVPRANVRLLLSPATPDAHGPATREEIGAALRAVYDAPLPIGRFFFYFAGHGLLTFRDQEHARTSTVLAPADIADTRADGYLMISFDEIYDAFRVRGPAEQFFFVDACRDLNYDRRPSPGPLGFDGDPIGAFPQSVLYAAQELNKAHGDKHGFGLMMRPLIDALHGGGRALHYDDARGQYVVTMKSLAEHVQDAIAERLRKLTAQERRDVLPTTETRGDLEPIRLLNTSDVEDVMLRVHVQPDSAAETTEVLLARGPVRPADDFIWPPQPNHEPVPVPPLLYRLKAEPRRGIAEPSERVFDARIEKEAHIKIIEPGDSSPPPPVAEAGPARAVARTLVTEGAEVGRIEARTLEPTATIDIERLESPYVAMSAVGEMAAAVPPGPYSVRFRLGERVFSEKTVYVGEGEVAEVTAQAEASPLLAEANAYQGSERVEVSEGLGAMQSAILPSVLPLLAVKPFDAMGEILPRFPDLDLRRAAEFREHPLSVVVAIDGNDWPVPPGRVLDTIRGSVVAFDSAGPRPEELLPRLEPLPQGGLDDIDETGRIGLRRIGTALAEPPEGTFAVALESTYTGRLTIFCTSLHRRITAVAVVLRPDGSFTLTQHLLRVPGERYDELVVTVPYTRLVRELQIAHELYASGELIRNARATDSSVLESLLKAKWTDPIVSCMAIHSWIALQNANDPEGLNAEWQIREAANNLIRYFGELPDSQVVYALVNPGDHDAIFSELLASGAIPLFAGHVHKLANFAKQHGIDASIVDIASQLALHQVWALALTPDGVGLIAQQQLELTVSV